MYKRNKCKGCNDEFNSYVEKPPELCATCRSLKFDIEQKIVYTETALKYSYVDRKLHENAIKNFKQMLLELEGDRSDEKN